MPGQSVLLLLTFGPTFLIWGGMSVCACVYVRVCVGELGREWGGGADTPEHAKQSSFSANFSQKHL